MITRFGFYIIIVTLCVAKTSAYAQVDSVMQSVTLDGVVVAASKNTLKIKNDVEGRTVVDMQLLRYLPQILGNADPIHYSQMLPEIQTNGEYRGGVNIQGCDNSHNIVAIGSVPIYNPSHLLGIFSTFNTTHYDKCDIDKFLDSKSYNRLGGELNMELPTYAGDTLCADVSLGMISSQGTIAFPICKNTFCKASFRKTYINLLYSKWLDDDDTSVKYSFYDLNFTLSHIFNAQHSITLDYYGGQDDGTFKAGLYTANMYAKWGNQMVALHHNYNEADGLRLTNNIYLTSYHNQFSLNMQGTEFRLPSSIFDVGFKHNATYKNTSWGLDAIYHHIEPQSLTSKGTIVAAASKTLVSNTIEVSAYVTYKHSFSSSFWTEAGLRANVYGSGSTNYFASADPSLSLHYKSDAVDVFIGYTLKHQYLFQTGFSDAGLPTEFWLSSSEDFRPQYAHSLNMGTSVNLFSRRYKLSGNFFLKKLYNQLEYTGSILDLVNTEYDLSQFLQQGKGSSYGFSLILSKQTGNITGWVSYTYTYARSEFSSYGLSGSFPANHERPHELNAVLTYDIAKHYSIGSTFVCASGIPFTAPDYLALINGNVIAHFREHNSSRLAPYCRLDLSITFKWQPKFAKESGINLSLYNATGQSNELYYYISTDNDGKFSYRPKSFFVRILPSISYYCKF